MGEQSGEEMGNSKGKSTWKDCCKFYPTCIVCSWTPIIPESTQFIMKMLMQTLSCTIVTCNTIILTLNHNPSLTLTCLSSSAVLLFTLQKCLTVCNKKWTSYIKTLLNTGSDITQTQQHDEYKIALWHFHIFLKFIASF